MLSPSDSLSDEDLVARAKKGDLLAKNELIRRFSVTLDQKSKVYSKAPIPLPAIRGEAMNLLLYAVEKFDPKVGVKFKTFLEQALKGLYRYTAANKNIARIPEHQVLQISRFQHAKDILQTQKNREPTSHELADSLGWSPAQVEKLETALSHRGIAMSKIEALHEQERIKDRMEEVLEFEYYGMTPEEKLVYDYSMGRHGKKQIEDVSEISKKTGLTTDKIYAVKRDIAKRVTMRL